MKKFFTVALSFIVMAMFAQAPDFYVDTDNGCYPLTVNFTNTSTTSPGDYFIWEFDDGTPNLNAVDGSHIFEHPGRYILRLTHFDYANNEYYNDNNYIEINVYGVDSIFATTGADACIGEDVRFYPYIYNSWVNFNNTKWIIDNDTLDCNNCYDVSKTFNTAGTHHVKFIADNPSCGIDTVERTIEVTNTATPIVELYNFGGDQVCKNDEIHLQSEYSAEHYFWDFDDGTTDTTKEITHTYTTLGGKNLTLTVTNICGNSASATININVRDDIDAYANFGYDVNANCPNTPISFSAYNPGTYSWTFDTIAVSSEKNPSVLFTDTGYYQIQLILSNGCGNSDTSKIDTFHVYYDTSNKPESNIQFDVNNSNGADTLNICPNQEVSFKNWTYPLQGVEHYWDFGDGDTSVLRAPTHIFNSSSQIMYIAQNQCYGRDTTYLWVNIDNNIQPSSAFLVLPDTICPGENTYFVDMNSNSSNGDPIDNNHIYNIDFGDGQSISNPSNFTDSILPIFNHIYDNLGTYNYTFSVTNQCGNTLDTNGVIHVLDNAHVINQYLIFNSTDPNYGGEKICPNDSVMFEAFGGAHYEWHFGDGSGIIDTNRTAFYAYPDTGTYNAYVIVTTNCGVVDTMNSIVRIGGDELPDAYFDIEGNGLCAGDTVEFAQNYGGMQYGYTYTWLLDNDTIGTGQELYYTFDKGGAYNVELSVTNGCGTKSEFRNVYVNSPILSFTVSDNVILPNDNVTFTNTSVNANTYSWDFGDGNTSTQASPVHSFADYGYYDITLSATNTAGCSASETFMNYILVSDIQVNADIKNASCNNNDVNGDNKGYINLSIVGGLPPYTITCQEDVTGSYAAEGQQMGVTFASLPPGLYHITITDANGTIIHKTYEITEPDPISTNVNYTEETCYHTADGKIQINTTGGTAPYTYTWVDDETNYILANNTDSLCNQITESPIKMYDVTITDANGCSYQLTGLQIPNPKDLFYDISILYPDCGSNMSNITINSAYNISALWFDNNTSLIRADLYAGNYMVTITDDEFTGCSTVENIVLTNNNSGFNTQYVNYTDYICAGSNNGFVGVLSSGGSGNYNYTWSANVTPSNKLNDSTIYNLPVGIYNLTVTDLVSACKNIMSFEIKELDAPEVYFSINNPTCYGSYTGSVIASSNSSVLTNYTYQWSNGSTTNQIINRPAGTYTVSVTDDYQCTTVKSVTIVNPPQMTLDISSSNVTSYGANNGVISVLVNNGTPYYSYIWSTGSDVNNSIDNLSPDTYFVTVSDINNCTATGSAIITEPAMIPISITVNDTLFCLGQTTNIEAPISTSYTYEWSTGETTSSITVGETGTYVVTVNDGISIGIDSANITVAHPYSDEKICMVTVDTSSMYNVIMWNKTENVGITEYKIYKLFGTQYLEIGSQPFDDYSVYTDSSSQPNVHADRYKISIVDTCGNESDLSPYHQTMYMGISDNTIGGNTIVILDWDEAIVNEGAQAIEWYYIYRGTDILALTKVDSVSGVFTGWNDNNSQTGYYYRVAYNVDEVCYPSSLNKTTGGPYNQSISNIDDYTNGPTDIDLVNNNEDIQIYPNPFFDKTRIYMPEELVNDEYTIKITDMSGKRILLEEKLKTRVYTLYRNNLPNGVYFVEIKGDKTYRKKLIIN